MYHHLAIAGTPIPFSDTIKMLGVTLDQNLTLNKHVSLLSHNIHFYTHVHCHIRPALAKSMAASLGASLVQSKLDYANSIMYGMSASNMHKLQSAQILSLMWFCLLFTIFQQVSDSITSTGFPFTTEYSSKSLPYL